MVSGDGGLAGRALNRALLGVLPRVGQTVIKGIGEHRPPFDVSLCLANHRWHHDGRVANDRPWHTCSKPAGHDRGTDHYHLCACGWRWEHTDDR